MCIRDRFYGYPVGGGTIAFASEAAELEGWVDAVRPFPPGHYYKDGRFVQYEDIACLLYTSSRATRAAMW